MMLVSPEDLKLLPVVCGPDHPLSLGYTVYLVTNSKYAFAEKRVTDEQFIRMMDGSGAAGMHATWDGRKFSCIAIRGDNEEEEVPPLRIVELAVHEVSHLVDAMFARACIEQVDTEFRAYHLDWLVGKVLHHFDLFKE